MTTRRHLFSVVVCSSLVCPGLARAQNPAEGLFNQVAELDALAFGAFNEHDLEGLMGFFSDDLEFFHDKDGISGHDDVEEGFRRLFAQDNGLRRELVAGSLEVHPIPGYGAIQIGQHKFCHWEKGSEDCGVFGFTHVWRHVEDRWQITRVLSYGH